MTTGSTDPAAILPQADLTIVCVPVNATIGFCQEQINHWRPGSIVTDVGSVKHDITRQLIPLFAGIGAAFVGSHPMAGSEKSGIAFASADLYRGATVFMTPAADQAPPQATAVAALWRSLGARVHALDAAQHDLLVAHTSHLLHLLAAAAVRVALSPADATLGTAGGFRDFTRIADSSTAMWDEIFQQNQSPILEALDAFADELTALRTRIAAGAWDAVRAYLEAAQQQRREWEVDWRRPRKGANG